MAEEIPGVWHNCPMSNEPVTDVAPVADSPRSRVEVFKSSTSYPESIDRREGESKSSSKEDEYKAFSIDESGKPTGVATAFVSTPATWTTWQPHDKDIKIPDTTGLVHLPDGSTREPTRYESRLSWDPDFKESGDAPLFYVDSSAPKVHDMWRTKGSGNLAGSYLLGAIGKQFSGINKPSYSAHLSPWSAGVVARAGKLGLVKENPDLPFSDVERTARDVLGEKKELNSNYDEALKIRYNTEDLGEALDAEYTRRKQGNWWDNDSGKMTEIPQEESEEFPKIVRSALADAKSQQFSEALKLPQEEDNTRDVPLPGFEEK